MAFLKTICTVSALLSLALLFLPEKPAVKRAAYTAFSLLLLLFLIPKDGSFDISSLISLDTAEAPESDVYEETLHAAVADGIRREVADRFSLNLDGVSVDTDMTVTESGLSGSYLSLSLGKENFFADATALLRYLKATYPVDCEVHFLGA